MEINSEGFHAFFMPSKTISLSSRASRLTLRPCGLRCGVYLTPSYFRIDSPFLSRKSFSPHQRTASSLFIRAGNLHRLFSPTFCRRESRLFLAGLPTRIAEDTSPFPSVKIGPMWTEFSRRGGSNILHVDLWIGQISPTPAGLS